MLRAYYEDQGVPHPSISSKPLPRSDCIKYLDAFRLLGSSRIWDKVGPKPISTPEVESFLNISGVEDPETKLKYLRLIRGMDLVELKYLNTQLKRLRK